MNRTERNSKTRRVSYYLHAETIKSLHDFVHINYTIRSNKSVIVERAIIEYLENANIEISNTLISAEHTSKTQIVCYNLSIDVLKSLHDFVHANYEKKLNMSAIAELAIIAYIARNTNITNI